MVGSVNVSTGSVAPSDECARPFTALCPSVGCCSEGVSHVSVLVAFSVTPLGVGESVGDLVAEAVRVVRDSGLPNRTYSMFTEVEGDTWPEVMEVVHRAVAAVAAQAPRVSVVIKADWRSAAQYAMTHKVEAVERHLSEP